MSFDSDDMVLFKGKMFSKEVLWHKCKGLGWTTKLFSQLSDEQIAKVLDERLTPEKMGVTMIAPETGQTKLPDLDSEEGSDPDVMGATEGMTISDDDRAHANVRDLVAEAAATLKPAPPANPTSEVALTAVAPGGKHLRPIDPTRSLPKTDQSGTPMPPMKSFSITIKPPKTDTNKLMSMLDAAFQLAQNDATLSTAKTLISTNGLERAFQALYSDLAKKVLGRIDTTPDAKCRGGVILDIENEAESGYFHIITTAGLITITGHGLVHKGANS